MKRLIMPVLVTGLCVLSLATSSAFAEGPKLADLLRQVPDDPALVVVVPNFSDAVAGIQAFGVAAGIQELSELEVDALWDEMEFSDLPGGWASALRKNGPIVFVLTETGSDPLLLATVTEPPDEQPTDLIQLKGQVLIVAPDSDVAAAIKSANGKFAADFLKKNQERLSSNDVLVYFNVPVWSTEIHQILSMGEMVLKAGAASAPQETPMNLTFIKWLFAKLRELSEQSRSLVLAAHIGTDGLHLGKRVEFDPESAVAAYLAQVKKPQQDLLRGLPAQPAMVVAAGEWQTPPEVRSISEQIVEVTLAELPTAEQDAEPPMKMTEQMRRLYRVVAGYNGLMVCDPDTTHFALSGVYLTDQPRAFFEGFPKLWECSELMMDAFSPVLKFTVTQSTDSIGSVEAQVYQLTFEAAEEQMRKVLTATYGNPATFYIAPHPLGVAYAFGPADVAKKQVEQILKEKGSPLASAGRTRQALKKLSPQPQGFLLIDIPAVMAWAIKIGGAMGETVPEIKPPTEPLPYLSLGFYLDKSAWSGELFFPAQVIKYITSVTSETPTSAPAGTEPY